MVLVLTTSPRTDQDAPSRQRSAESKILLWRKERKLLSDEVLVIREELF